MATKKYLSLDRLTEYDTLIKAEITDGDSNTLSSAKSYTDTKVSNITSGTTVVAEATHAASADTATTADSANAVAWSNVTGKPSTYTPASHAHAISDVTNLQTTIDTINSEVDGSIKSLSVSGKTITYTKNDGTTGTITTQDTNTDTKVTNTLATTTKAYITGTTSASTNTGTQVFDTGVYLDTTAGMLTATTFKGSLSGNATTATSATSATKATQDASGNVITSTYETKTDASAKLTEAKEYADEVAASAAASVKDDLLNGAGGAYDTLSELGTLIDENVDAIEALETVAAGKADASHTHGNITNAGAIGTTSGKAVITTTNGVLTTGTVPVASGGTGATTAAAALTNLGLTATAAELNIMDGVTATTAEINYLDGVTSAIQTQLDGKAASSHSHTITATATDDDVIVLTGTNGSNKVTFDAKHATSGVTASTYKSVTVNKYGHVTAGSNPTTLAGYGITDAYTKTAVDSALSGKAASSHTHSAATTSAAGFMSASDKTKLDSIATGATAVTVDSALSSSSTNPVQNKVVNSALTTATEAISANTASITSHTTAITNLQTAVAEFEEITSAEIQALFA